MFRSLFLAFTMGVAALSATSAFALTATDEASIKASATALARGMTSTQGSFDQDGKLKRTSTGAVVTTTAGSSSTQNGLAYVNKVNGIESFSAQGSPAQAGGLAGGSVQSSSSVDFQCGRDDRFDTIRVAGGVSVKLLECIGTAPSAVQAIKLSVCSASLQGSVCTSGAFSAPATLRPGDYSEVQPGISVGYACNTAAACRVTVRHAFSRVGTGASLAAQAQSGAEAPTALVDKITATYVSDSYEKHYTTTAVAASACVQATNESLQRDGTASTCDGKKTVTVAGVTPEACSPVWECSRNITQTATYSRSCTQTFPLTSYSCTMSIPTKECLVTLKDGGTTSSCSAADLTGASLVDSDPENCTAKDAAGACTASTKNEYYTFPDQASRVGDCSAFPSPVDGPVQTACAARGTGPVSSCEVDGWFRRSLSESDCTVSRDDGKESAIDLLTSREKAGCGVCVRPIHSDTCRAQPSKQFPADSCENADIDLSICKPVTVTPESSTLGLTESQRVDYICQAQETSCAERKLAPGSCVPSDLTHGTDIQPLTTGGNQAAMNEALAASAIIDEMSKTNTGPSAPPLIFNAKASAPNGSWCRTPKSFSSTFSNDCCQINLQKASDGGWSQCSKMEVELAGSRRANLAHYVGEYCSKKFLKKCIERTSAYCEYTGLLARIVQEQGRAQLAALAASPIVAPATATLAFNFYDSASGQWTTPIELNGVKIAAWQTPAACRNPTGDSAATCPSALTQWFAACNKPSGCSDLPLIPEFGSDTWLISAVNPLESRLTAISPVATVSGACNTETSTCSYAVTALPAATGGRAMVTRFMSFTLAANPTPDQTLNLQGAVVHHGDIMVRPYTQIGAIGSVATPPPIQVSLNGGVSWTSYTLPLAIPSTIPLPGTSLEVSGGCDRASNNCSYRISGMVTVMAKPWGPPQNPDCSGFTLGQLSVLDFSKMDLSEWIASVMKKAKTPDSAQLASEATAEAKRYFEVYQNGNSIRQTATAPTRAKTADVSPAQGWGPFTTTLRVTSNYPQIFTSTEDGRPDPKLNVDPVHAVEVDWGDCTLPEQVPPYSGTINGFPANGFMAEHTYASPDKLACGDRGERNYEHTVRIKVHAKSGIYETTSRLLNLWTGPVASAGGSEGQGGTSAIIIKGQ